MREFVDRNGRRLSIGDRVQWRSRSYQGEIIGCPTNETNEGQIKVLWDHRSDNQGWHFASDFYLMKVNEAAVTEFINSTAKDGFLGRNFCRKFSFVDAKLSDERCPVKVLRRLADHYVGDE